MACAFEFPLTERIRFFLKFEHLAKQLKEKIFYSGQIPALSALADLCDLLEICGNKDVLKEIRHQLRHQLEQFKRLQGRSDIKYVSLEKYLARVKKGLLDLDTVSPDFFSLNNNPIISVARRRFHMIAGVCSFDAPILAAWENKQEVLTSCFDTWWGELEEMSNLVFEILDVSRECANSEDVEVKGGHCRRHFLNASENKPQMLRLRMHGRHGIFPDMSVGKYGFSFHLFEIIDVTQRPQKVTYDVTAEISLSSI